MNISCRSIGKMNGIFGEFPQRCHHTSLGNPRTQPGNKGQNWSSRCRNGWVAGWMGWVYKTCGSNGLMMFNVHIRRHIHMCIMIWRTMQISLFTNEWMGWISPTKIGGIKGTIQDEDTTNHVINHNGWLGAREDRADGWMGESCEFQKPKWVLCWF